MSAGGQLLDTFSWLHLTDLHWGVSGQKPLWPTIREEFFEDLAALHAQCGPWQVVLFTGDFVQQGAAAEYAELEEKVLGPLWECLGKLGREPVLLAVPGNHDLQRPDGKSLRTAVTLLKTPGMFAGERMGVRRQGRYRLGPELLVGQRIRRRQMQRGSKDRSHHPAAGRPCEPLGPDRHAGKCLGVDR